MRIILVSTLMILVITAAFVLHMNDSDYLGKFERFSNFKVKSKELDAVGASNDKLAALNQGLPLSDFLAVETGVTGLGAEGCASEDSSRVLELVSYGSLTKSEGIRASADGQLSPYGQQTNNYRRHYPDNCSSPLTEFVGGIYNGEIGK